MSAPFRCVFVSRSRLLNVSASPRAKSWADAFTTRAAAHAGAASARFCTCLAAFVWCGDQRELLIKVGAVTGFADGSLAGANEGLKLFAASAAAISKDRHDCSRTNSLTLGMCPSQMDKSKCDRVAYWRDSEVSECAPHFRLLRHTGPVRHR